MPREVVTRQPPARPAPEASSFRLDATLAFWLTLFVFGGGLLALYYADIGYFPEVTWQDALTYLALMAILGGSLLVAYCFLLFVPGAIWSEYLVHDEQVGPVLTMAKPPGKPCVWSIGKRIVVPFALFMAFCHSLLYLQPEAGASAAFLAAGAAASLAAGAGLMWKDIRMALARVDGRRRAGSISGRRPLSRWAVATRRRASAPRGASLRDDLAVFLFHAPLLWVFVRKVRHTGVPEAEVLWFLALLPLGGLLFLFSGGPQSTPLRSGSARRIPDLKSVLCRSILAFGGAALISLAALWFFHRIYSEDGTEPSQVPASLLFLCTLVVIVTNLAVAVVFRESRRQAFAASFLAAMVLLGAGQLLGGSGAGLPTRIMERFGFGARAATVVLTEKGGRLLCRHGIPVQLAEASWPAGPVAPQGSGDATQPPEQRPFARAAELEILSRLGAELVLRYGGVGGRIVAVPKSDVLSWSAGSGPRFQSDCPPSPAVQPGLKPAPAVPISPPAAE